MEHTSSTSLELLGAGPTRDSVAAVRQSRRSRKHGWPTTPKDLLQRARASDRTAVASLYGLYRHSLRNLFRTERSSADQAEDLTQGFFEGAIKRNDFARLDPERSFRAWLHNAARCHLFNERARERASKRDLDEQKAVELRRDLEESQQATAERAVDQLRAKALVDRAWARLRPEYERLSKGALFEHLRKTLLLDVTDATDAELCLQLGHCRSYVAAARHHLRNHEFPAAVIAELKAARGGPQPPTTPSRSIQEDLRALLDAAR